MREIAGFAVWAPSPSPRRGAAGARTMAWQRAQARLAAPRSAGECERRPPGDPRTFVLQLVTGGSIIATADRRLAAILMRRLRSGR